MLPRVASFVARRGRSKAVKPLSLDRLLSTRASSAATQKVSDSSRAPILVVGSACVDCFIEVPRLPHRGETLASHNTRTGTLLPGGKGANQAAAAAQFGATTYFNGRFGDDPDADTLEQTLGDFGVDLSLTRRDPTCPSGKAFIFLEPTGENSIVIVQGTNVEGWAPENLLGDGALEDKIRAAGAVMLQREIPDFVNLEVAKFAASVGVPVLLDVGGKDTPVDTELAPHVTICWPNETELMHISGGMPTETNEQIAEAVAKLRDQGIRDVLVTLGKSGSMMFEANANCMDDVVRMKSFPVDKVVDTTGAGDCFRAAYSTARYSEGHNIRDSLMFGSAASALLVQQIGAMTAPTRAEVVKFLNDRGEQHPF